MLEPAGHDGRHVGNAAGNDNVGDAFDNNHHALPFLWCLLGLPKAKSDNN